MSLARSSPSYGTQPYPTALLDIYRSIRLLYVNHFKSQDSPSAHKQLAARYIHAKAIPRGGPSGIAVEASALQMTWWFPSLR